MDATIILHITGTMTACSHPILPPLPLPLPLPLPPLRPPLPSFLSRNQLLALQRPTLSSPFRISVQLLIAVAFPDMACREVGLVEVASWSANSSLNSSPSLPHRSLPTYHTFL
ncbi:unnamed protein product [Closterium sp. NIES-64]|nr:unnamed protein product [Closterium sp. NIES-64]